MPGPTSAPAGRSIYGLTALISNTVSAPNLVNIAARGEPVAFEFPNGDNQLTHADLNLATKTIVIGQIYDPATVQKTPATGTTFAQRRLRLEEPGTYRVIALQSDGRYQEIGQVTIKHYGPTSDTVFQAMDPATTARVNAPTTLTLQQGNADVIDGEMRCRFNELTDVTVDAAAKTVRLGRRLFPLDPASPECAPSMSPQPAGTPSVHRHAFAVTLPQPGTYSVLALTAAGVSQVGTVTAE
jgi:hypothetical protein